MKATSHALDEGPFKVLFVCTANQSRSPLAENLLRASLHRFDVDWVVTSAGVHARDGDPMDELAAAVLDEREIPHADWTTRRLNATRIAGADLVLTAEVSHRQVVTTMWPAAVRYCFTLLQFSRLLALSEPTGADDDLTLVTGPELIHRAVLARARPQSRDDHLIELADPTRRSIGVYRSTADQIEAALRVVERVLRPQSLDAEVPMGGPQT